MHVAGRFSASVKSIELFTANACGYYMGFPPWWGGRDVETREWDGTEGICCWFFLL